MPVPAFVRYTGDEPPIQAQCRFREAPVEDSTALGVCLSLRHQVL